MQHKLIDASELGIVLDTVDIILNKRKIGLTFWRIHASGILVSIRMMFLGRVMGLPSPTLFTN